MNEDVGSYKLYVGVYKNWNIVVLLKVGLFHIKVVDSSPEIPKELEEDLIHHIIENGRLADVYLSKKVALSDFRRLAFPLTAK